MAKGPKHIARHEAQCAVCKSPRRKELDAEYMSGGSPIRLAQTYGFGKDSVYGHVIATGLRKKRFEDTLGCLTRLIEYGENLMDAKSLDINASTIAQAVRIMAEIKKQIADNDPTILIFQNLDPEVRENLAESIKNRFADVGNTDN